MKDYYTEIRNKLDDGLCEFCPYVREEVDHCPGRGCDGMYCDEAVNNYTMETQDEQDNKNGTKEDIVEVLKSNHDIGKQFKKVFIERQYTIQEVKDAFGCVLIL